MVMIREFAAKVKAVGTADGLDEGQFEAIVSVFGNVDSYGDRVMPGAFADDVKRWKAGQPLPVIWSHKWDDPFAHIGYALDADETDRGLWVKGQIEDLADNPTAAQVHRLLKARRVTQFSFAYDVLDGGQVDEEIEAGGEKVQRSVYELRKLMTHEVGPCLLGVNQETELLGAKAANLALATVAGRRLDGPSVKRLGHVIDALREVIQIHSIDPQAPTVEPSTTPVVDNPVPDPVDPGKVTPVSDEPRQTDSPPDADDPAQGKAPPAGNEIPRRRLAAEILFL